MSNAKDPENSAKKTLAACDIHTTAPKDEEVPQQLVFRNQDILRIILDFISEEEDCRPSRLMGLALVSQAFKESSLDYLWRKLDSHVPIVKLLPDLVQQGNRFDFSGTLSLSRLSVYASRVRELILPEKSPGFVLSAHSLARLSMQLNGRPLLRNLRVVYIHALDATSTALIPILIPPSVETLEFRSDFMRSIHLYRSVLPALPADFPGLKRLVLDQGHSASSSQSQPPSPPLPLSSIADLQKLRHLIIRAPSVALPANLLTNIGRNLVHLETLSLDVGNSLLIPDEGSIHLCPFVFFSWPIVKPFPSLKSVHLTIRRTLTTVLRPSLHLCLACSGHILSYVKSLHVRFEPGSNPSATPAEAKTRLSDICRWLAELPALETVEFSGKLPYSNPISSADIAAIIGVQPLRDITIRLADLGPSATGSGWLRELVDAGFGPAHRRTATLRRLVLPPKSTLPASMRGLRHVGLAARGLEELSLPIDSSIGSFQAPFANPEYIPSSTLRRLVVNDVRATDDFTLMEHRNIAQFIDRTFPNLESVVPYRNMQSGGGSQHVEHWKFIEQLRKDLKSAREKVLM
ncbi:hypothetical protein FA15DRAFT_697001 [Coprinopsis marcescibilis]|uniref:F-box domain-containing protein n=1 Tax=Coprinopsis marcescibilis TaxID=230819 RepID=A0A5C3KK97_COPMA|nr:hypothetical protein FA15DRAFT_697001 [Coprinopsis marcescibilis]